MKLTPDDGDRPQLLIGGVDSAGGLVAVALACDSHSRARGCRARVFPPFLAEKARPTFSPQILIRDEKWARYISFF
jgi:hypothetical protein